MGSSVTLFFQTKKPAEGSDSSAGFYFTRPDKFLIPLRGRGAGRRS